jgi:1-acyl-sn-glycerol-3-phosphate acyltransferase
VAAADYFLTRPLRRWFATRIVGIIPIDRTKTRRDDGKHPLQPISDVLDDQGIVLLFPEGTRGEPERMDRFQTGIAHLAKRHPDVPVTPVFMYGLGKALPKGEAILVPFFCDVFVGEPIPVSGDKQTFMTNLQQAMDALAAESPEKSWAEA